MGSGSSRPALPIGLPPENTAPPEDQLDSKTSVANDPLDSTTSVFNPIHASMEDNTNQQQQPQEQLISKSADQDNSNSNSNSNNINNKNDNNSKVTWKQKMFGRNTILKKSDLRTGFTEDYGDSVNMICFLCAIYSRLAYMNDHQFLGHYSLIFGPIIPNDVLSAMNQQVLSGQIQNLLNDQVTFDLVLGQDKYGLKTFASKPQFGGVGLQFLPWAQQINIVNGEQRMSAENANCDFEVREKTSPDSNLVFISITTSNYNEIYIIGDKRMPNIVIVSFRGTSDAKSAGSYSKASSTVPIWTGNLLHMESSSAEGENKEKFLYGIYKILMDTIHVLMRSIEYVAKKIKANDSLTSVITTGHSLGGALATLFSYVYVTHISNDREHFSNILNPSIGCFGLGAPRVLSAQLAHRFCQLTTNNDNINDPDFKESFLSQIPGRITYLRIVTKNDPVPNLPPASLKFAHPCSGNELARKNTNVDCLTQVENSFSNRCRGTRLAMTYNFEKLPLNCVDSKEAREKNKGPFLAKNPMAYHTEYLGISFIGGLPLSNVVGNNIQRVKDGQKMGDTVCRVIFYPSISGDFSLASIGFYDLIDKKDKGNNPALNVSDVEFEKTEMTEESNAPTLLQTNENNDSSTNNNTLKPVKVLPNTDFSYTTKVKSLVKNMVGQDTMLHVPEDIYDTSAVFEKLIQNTENYNILTEKPPIQYKTLVILPNNSTDASFEETKPAPSLQGGRTKRKRTKKTTLSTRTKKTKRKRRTTKMRRLATRRQLKKPNYTKRMRKRL